MLSMKSTGAVMYVYMYIIRIAWMRDRESFMKEDEGHENVRMHMSLLQLSTN